MLSPVILIPAVLNGLMTGAVYALIALGLTLIYGVLHIINFAHGALLTAAMFAAFFAYHWLGLDPYIAAIGLTPIFFLLGYVLQRFIIGPAAHGRQHLFWPGVGGQVEVGRPLAAQCVPDRAADQGQLMAMPCEQAGDIGGLGDTLAQQRGSCSPLVIAQGHDP